MMCIPFHSSVNPFEIKTAPCALELPWVLRSFRIVITDRIVNTGINVTISKVFHGTRSAVVKKYVLKVKMRRH